MTLPIGGSAHEERKAYPPKHGNTSAPRPPPGHDLPCPNRVPGEPGPAGFPLHHRSTRGGGAADAATGEGR